jgi:hypothetical protein
MVESSDAMDGSANSKAAADYLNANANASPTRPRSRRTSWQFPRGLRRRFFKISFSSSRRASSRLSAVSSSGLTLGRPAPRKAWSHFFSASCAHLYRRLRGIPSSRATVATGLPLVCIIRMASRLNSALNLRRFSLEHLPCEDCPRF